MSHDIVDNFSTHLKNVLTRALCFVVDLEEKTIEPEHLLWALGTQKGCIGAEILKKSGIKTADLRTLVGATERIKSNLAAAQNVTLNLSPDAKRIVEKAVLTANIYGHRYVGTEHLLSGILQTNSEGIFHFFLTQKTNLTEIKQQLSIVLKSTSKFPDLAKSIGKQQGMVTQATDTAPTADAEEVDKMPALHFFGRELTDVTTQKTIDPVIGRESEIERLMQILCRRTKNNPLLCGAPGVGKTAIIEGLAKRIVEGQVPPALADKRIFALDMALLIAGTMYRGEFESRLRQVVEEVKKNGTVILFIDEIHTLVGAGAASGSMDAANILKPALSRGEIRCIGATTPEEYKKHLESDSALERRFQTIPVEEPSLEDAQLILQGLAPYYEAFHHVRISPEAIEQAVKLSARYVTNRQLPDKAIDLIDEASAAVRLEQTHAQPVQNRRVLEQELDQVRETKRQAVVEERFLDALDLKEQEDRVRTSLETTAHQQEHATLPPITAKEIAQVISRVTGIPVSDLIERNSVGAEEMSRTLTSRVLGQSQVVNVVAGALHRAKSGLSHPKRPLSSFLFLGPSGVGKSELARAIAHTFFHTDKNFIRLDMSEYAEGFTVSKLIGAPAGYVGYKEQANLTDRVKQRPYSVVLFDEIEKAHRDVQNLLLQILEEGELTDATGRLVNFKNTLVILTSNVGLEKFEQGSVGFSSSPEEAHTSLRLDIRKELDERFRPELINRIDHLCVFEPLTKEVIGHIVKKELAELVSRVKEQHGVIISTDKKLIPLLVEKIDPRFGARTVRQCIQSHVETCLADRLTKKDRPTHLRIDVRHAAIAVTKAKS